jgi:hypothetical protein
LTQGGFHTYIYTATLIQPQPYGLAHMRSETTTSNTKSVLRTRTGDESRRLLSGGTSCVRTNGYNPRGTDLGAEADQKRRWKGQLLQRNRLFPPFLVKHLTRRIAKDLEITHSSMNTRSTQGDKGFVLTVSRVRVKV